MMDTMKMIMKMVPLLRESIEMHRRFFFVVLLLSIYFDLVRSLFVLSISSRSESLRFSCGFFLYIRILDPETEF